jgi:hypothetical protein
LFVGSGGEDDGLLVFGLHFRVEAAKLGIFFSLVVDLSQEVVATDGEAVRSGLRVQRIDSKLLKAHLVARGKRFYGEVGWELDTDSILIDESVGEVDRYISFLMREGGFCIGFEEICRNEQALAGRGAYRAFELKVRDEGLIIVLELVDRGDLDVGSGWHEAFDEGAEFAFKTFVVSDEAALSPINSRRAYVGHLYDAGDLAVFVHGQVGYAENL